MQLDGFLSRFALRELLELSVASLVSGVLEVQSPTGAHRLFFLAGRLVHAAAPRASGFDALWPLFELSEASFHFVAGATTRERTFAEPTLQVIERAAALAQRWSTVRPFIPHLDIVPELVSPVKGDHVRIFEEDWPVLSSVDGMRTIHDIAQKALLDPLEACVGLLRLKERGLVKLSMTTVSRAQPVPAVQAVVAELAAPSAPTPVTRPSFFAKLLNGVTPEQPAPPPPATADGPQVSPHVEQDDILSLLRS